MPNFGKQPNFESHTKDFEWEKAYILQVDIYLLKICLRKDLQNKLKKNRFPMGLSTKYTIAYDGNIGKKARGNFSHAQ